MNELEKEINRIETLTEMLLKNLKVHAKPDFSWYSGNYPKNHNQSKAALKNQIVTLRNELLVLSKEIDRR